MSIERNKIEVVRCPAIGGACVEVSSCRGFVSESGTQLLLPCPYFLSEKGQKLRCTFHPNDPKRVLRREGPGSRPSAMVQGEMRMTAERVFALQVHAGERLGSEWESARVNNVIENK